MDTLAPLSWAMLPMEKPKNAIIATQIFIGINLERKSTKIGCLKFILTVINELISN